MSKIFEVLQKNSAFDLEGISDQDGGALPQDSAAPAIPAGETPAHDVSILAERVISLRVSALAPIFPFSEKAHHPAAEQYRIVRTKILHSEKKPRFVLVSSACTGDGKTVTSLNIAASLTLKEDTSVLLVDADLRKPAIAELLGIPRTPGLGDVLSGRARLDEAVVRAQEFTNFFILPAGEAAHDAAELLDSDRWRSLTEEIRGRFQNVIIDAPPAAAVADYDLLQKTCDGVIVVVRPDHTNRTACVKLLQSIPKEKFLGVVLNHVQEWLFGKAPSYYHYYGKRQAAVGR
jgi:capsular exopolysaccharide synthesis family protein